MSDEARRRLEREAAADDDPVARGRALREQLRRGELEPDKLELAKWLGDEGARIALDGDAGAQTPPEVWQVGALIEGIARFGREAQERAAIALARVAAWSVRRLEEDDASWRAIERAEAFFLARTDETRRAFEAALRGEETRYYRGGGGARVVACILASDTYNEDDPEAHFDTAFLGLATAFDHLNPRFVSGELADELVPWALGRRDPIATRAEREGRRFASGEDMVRAVAFAASGARVLVADRVGHVRLLGFPAGETALDIARGGDVFAAALSLDEQKLISGDSHGVVCIHRVADGLELARFPSVGDDDARAVALLGPTGERAVSISLSGAIRVRDLTGGGAIVVERQAGARTNAAFSADGTTLVTSSGDTGRILVWDTATFETRRTLERKPGSVEDVALSADGRTLALARDGEGLEVVDAATGETRRVLAREERPARVVALSARRAAVATQESRRILVWDLETGALERDLHSAASMTFALAFSPDGTKLVGGERGGALRLYELGPS